ncbi:MAG TPA: histidinol-phosphatase [Bacteroidales bacterium]|nr:histidinol-phosphatase [Bacteroidales bacterium]
MINIRSLYYHNFHTHTSHCDGSSPAEEYVKAALDAGLLSIGFSGHAPVPLKNGFAIRDEKCLDDYCRDILTLREKYKGKIEIYLGLEVDYIPGVTPAFGALRSEWPLDYIIGSVHLVKNLDEKLWFIDGPDRQLWLDGLHIDYKQNVKKAVGDYYRQVMEMVETQKPDVVGHIDKVKMHNREEYFREDEPWYREMIISTLDAVKRMNTIVEVNTRGLYKKRSDSLFPGLWVLEEMHRLGIHVTISTDAHKPEEVALLLREAVDTLKTAGYKEAYIFGQTGWVGISLE